MTGPAGPPPADDEAIQVQGYHRFRAPEGHSGQGILINTSRGNIFSLFHPTETMDAAVLWVWGARGGVTGPADSIYVRLAERLAGEGIASLRLDYRLPNDLYECVLDTLAGTTLLLGVGFKRLALVGHSFGGAVAIAAAPYNDKIVAVVGLSSQSAGAQRVSEVAPQTSSPRPRRRRRHNPRPRLPVHLRPGRSTQGTPLLPGRGPRPD